jgi:hypothetical protein
MDDGRNSNFPSALFIWLDTALKFIKMYPIINHESMTHARIFLFSVFHFVTISGLL